MIEGQTLAKLTICLPVFNGADDVQDALQSIADQTSDDFVVLASDNGSTDATGAILQDWSGKLPMTVLTQPSTIAMQDHFNLLLDRVQTEFLMVLCHDDYFANPDAIKEGLAIVDANPDVSAVYCDLAFVSRHGRRLATRRFGRDGPFDAEDAGRATLRTARNMFGIPLIMRRSVLGRSRYDNRFHYVMDVDLSWTLSQRTRAWHIPHVMIANRYRRSNATWTLLSSANEEFVALAEKHGVALTGTDRRRLAWTNWIVARKKQAFGLYERLVTAIG